VVEIAGCFRHRKHTSSDQTEIRKQNLACEYACVMGEKLMVNISPRDSFHMIDFAPHQLGP
jgi:hypothetical protein